VADTIFPKLVFSSARVTFHLKGHTNFKLIILTEWFAIII
jgi:hypothetical protein